VKLGHSAFNTTKLFRATVVGRSVLECSTRGEFCHVEQANLKSLDSSVGIALGYGLDDRCSSVRFPAGAGNCSLHHRDQNGSGAHPASYPMGNRGSFPGGKAAGA
jgi:hypothetical protein